MLYFTGEQCQKEMGNMIEQEQTDSLMHTFSSEKLVIHKVTIHQTWYSR